jgi:Ca2+-binding RTX toxin-like protein
LLNDTLTGGSGVDTFVATAGHDTITDFKVASKTTVSAADDHIDLTFAGFADNDALDAAMQQVGKNVDIDLGGGNILTINHTTIDILQAHHSGFILH